MMFGIEVRRRDNNAVLRDEGFCDDTMSALRTAAGILHDAGACMFSAHNKERENGVPFIEVFDESFPFHVVILNTQIVDEEGEPMPVGSGIGPFPTKALGKPV
jgi:hypothetical protein